MHGGGVDYMEKDQSIALTKIIKAMSQLDLAIAIKTPSDLERDGGIQRFEYCLELTWKIGKKYLSSQGLDASTPKEVFRLLGQTGLINNVDKWFQFLIARNYSSHTYQEAVANWVWAQAKEFSNECHTLVNQLGKNSPPQA